MNPAEIETYTLHFGDCVPFMAELPDASIDFAVFSPPFPQLYAYNNDLADIGNSEDLRGEAKLHLSFFYRQFARVLKPGRVAIVHVAQIPRMKRSGEEGLMDFRGFNIRLGERAGLTFDYDWMVAKNPQSQAIRNRAWELKFQGIETDRARSRGTLPDYLLKFRAPGENAVKIVDNCSVSRNDWISWAECCWSWQDVRETDTLNVRGTKGEDDTKHVCALQLPVIDRLVRLYSNVGELVFSPFAGIGSEGYQALIRGRRFLGCELKQEYHVTALKNLARAERIAIQDNRTLFDEALA